MERAAIEPEEEITSETELSASERGEEPRDKDKPEGKEGDLGIFKDFLDSLDLDDLGTEDE